MTKQMQEFDYYCLDRIKPLSEDFTVTVNDGNIIKKLLYKIGLRASIKHTDCYCLYTESEQDLDHFLFIPVEKYNDYQRRFYLDVFSEEDIKSIIKSIKTINIFEFTSLLCFTHIYQDFKEFLEYNWTALDMDDLIEI